MPSENHDSDHARAERAPEHGHEAPRRLMLVRILLFWAFVAIPLVWGVSETVQRALGLFR